MKTSIYIEFTITMTSVKNLKRLSEWAIRSHCSKTNRHYSLHSINPFPMRHLRVFTWRLLRVSRCLLFWQNVTHTFPCLSWWFPKFIRHKLLETYWCAGQVTFSRNHQPVNIRKQSSTFCRLTSGGLFSSTEVLTRLDNLTYGVLGAWLANYKSNSRSNIASRFLH